MEKLKELIKKEMFNLIYVSNTKKMKAFLRQFNLFSEIEIETFVGLGRLRKYNAGEFFIQEGKTSQEVGFIQAGIFRSFYYTQAAEEVTYCFNFPNQFVSAYSSYISGRPSPENIQAITPVEVLLFTKEDLNAFVDKHISGLRFARQIAELQYLEMEKRVLMLQKEQADVKYAALLEGQPEVLQQVPLQYVASYLGISQRHLSRLRKKMSTN